MNFLFLDMLGAFLNKAGLSANLNTHSTIRLSLKDESQLNIEIKNEVVILWMYLSEYNSDELERISLSLYCDEEYNDESLSDTHRLTLKIINNKLALSQAFDEKLFTSEEFFESELNRFYQNYTKLRNW